MQMILLTLVGCFLSGFLGGYIAVQKRRSETEGFLFGFMLGPLGWLLEALLPNGDRMPGRPPVRKRARIGSRPPRDDALDQEVADWFRDPK